MLAHVYKDAVAIEDEGKAKEQEYDTHPCVACPGKKDREGFEAVSLRYVNDNWWEDHDDHEERNKYTGPGSKGERCLCPQKEVEVNPAVDEEKDQKENGFNCLFVIDHKISSMNIGQGRDS